VTAQDRIEISGLAHPDVLLAGITRHIFESVLAEKIINETGAIHPAIRGICGAVAITQILFCQLQACINDLAHFLRIIVVA
jgi:hypothetical protein